MTGREAGFLLLGIMIGIIVTIVYQFIHGFFQWKRMNAQRVGTIQLGDIEPQEGISLRIRRDEDGQFHIEEIKESEDDAETGVHSTADSMDGREEDSAGEGEDSESVK